MAYANTGYQRATTLTISANGNEDKTFSLLDAFTDGSDSYSAITATDIAQMVETDYTARVVKFINYVTTQYPELTVSLSGSRVENLTVCPVG